MCDLAEARTGSYASARPNSRGGDRRPTGSQAQVENTATLQGTLGRRALNQSPHGRAGEAAPPSSRRDG